MSVKKVSSIPYLANDTLFKRLSEIEPRAMHGQPQVLWHRAQDCFVFDEFGNKFIDFSSGVLIANCGHNHPKVNQAIRDVLDQGLLTSYIFLNRHRIKLIEKILQHVPEGMEQVLLLCSGSEAIEASLKLAKNYSKIKYGEKKNLVLSFIGSFHGRTLGAQVAGGIPQLKSWIEESYKKYIQLPFPDCEDIKTCDFSHFQSLLQQQNITSEDISCVLFETYQGGVVKFAPVSFMKELRAWCTKNNVILILDEVQAGFGRTGKWWGFEHYDIIPDLIACGKGISSSLPVSAVIGKKELMDQFPSGAMSTTHSGNPVCCAAAVANIEVLESEQLVKNSEIMGQYLHMKMDAIKRDFPHIIGACYGKGLVCGVHIINKENGLPDSFTAKRIVDLCVSKGLMLFNPVGPCSATIKLNPPLTISRKILELGLEIFKSSLLLV